MKVLMLAPWMRMGHGVSELIARLAQPLADRGIDTTVGCLGRDDHYRGLDIRAVDPTPDAVGSLAVELGAGGVVALGTPYFEVLPHLDAGLRTVAYEAGDPTPELFGDDAHERRRIVEHKIARVYPHVDAVAAISGFVRSDIGWPAAQVIRLGIDHVPDLGNKPWAPPASTGPLRIGALTRLGVGEARYKGVEELLGLARELDALEVDARVELMGRGEPESAAVFERHGIRVHRNASEEERNAYLRALDVFVTTSLWEGTNLPLVEAQALGTPGLALDTGAHPEFTPLVFGSVPEMARQIQAYTRDPDRRLLAEHGRAGRRFVRSTMCWATAADELAGLLRGAAPPPPRPTAAFVASSSVWRKTVRSLQREGLRPTASKARAHLAARRGHH